MKKVPAGKLVRLTQFINAWRRRENGSYASFQLRTGDVVMVLESKFWEEMPQEYARLTLWVLYDSKRIEFTVEGTPDPTRIGYLWQGIEVIET